MTTESAPDLDLALDHVVRCAMVDSPCAALLIELRRLYAAAGEPIPPMIRQHSDSRPALGSLFADDEITYTIAADPVLLRDL